VPEAGSPSAAKAVVTFCETNITELDKSEAAIACTYDRLIFFNLRTHNKSWLNQVDGIIFVANRAEQQGVTLAIYLDGMADCREAADEIVRRAPMNCLVIDGIGKSMTSTIYWASICDAYVATIGSGLTLLTWIAGKKGVAHSEHHHLSQMEFWPDIRPDVPQPVAVPANEVTEVGTGTYGNYCIRAEIVADLLWPLLGLSAN
jgi:hypothetical protein